MNWTELIDKGFEFLKQYGPALGTFIVMYYRDLAVEAKNKQRIAELESKMVKNKNDVAAEDVGLSPGDIINKYAGSKSDN